MAISTNSFESDAETSLFVHADTILVSNFSEEQIDLAISADVAHFGSKEKYTLVLKFLQTNFICS